MTKDGGRTWRAAETKRPGGYRSGVAYSAGPHRRELVTVGPAGSDYSLSDGQSWRLLSETGFHSVSFAPDGSAGWAVGEQGRIARYDPRGRF